MRFEPYELLWASDGVSARVPTRGAAVLANPRINRGTAFTEEERTGGIDRRIRQIIGDRDYEIVCQSIYRFHARHTDRMRVGRVLIAGDCAHLVSPFGARGLNSGVQDAGNAAWKGRLRPPRVGRRGPAPPVTSRNASLWTSSCHRTSRPGSIASTSSSGRSPIRSLVKRSTRAGWPNRSGTSTPLTTPDPTRTFPGRPPRGQTPLATCAAVDGADTDAVAEVLRVDDGSALAERARAVAPRTAARARSLLRAYGSCSTSEPVEDLTALGLLEVARS